MTLGLVGFVDQEKGKVEILSPKTHFEQIPLEIVNKIVDDQIKRRKPTEPGQKSDHKTSNDGDDQSPVSRSK